ncbi:MAG: type 1 glutamine amidotransferase [Mesorhizobium sp.]|nr:type 1 glutamine amidotransferase [Mesorhizobium sp.]
MKVLVVQNFDNTGLGNLRAAFAEVDAELETVRAHRGEALPDGPEGHDAIVVLGGGQNALADEEWPYLPKLAALMRAFADSGRSTLGICLGSQILARAYGADNLIGAAPEFGWQQVALTPEGKADPVLGSLPERFPIFQWHDDTFTLPRGGQRLAGNDSAHNQAFRVGRAGYGIQFHFEADRELVREWNEAFSDYLAERQPSWSDLHPSEAERHGPEADAAGLAIARAFVATIGK